MKLLGSFEVEVFKHKVNVYIGLPETCTTNVVGHCMIVPVEQEINIYLDSKECFTGYVMHECVHAADFILNNIGADMGTNPNDSEVRAYLSEYIFCMTGCLLGRVKKKTVKRKSKK